MAREQDMHRLTVDGVTYLLYNEHDFLIARDISRRIDNTRTQFQGELNKRWIKWGVDEKPYANPNGR
jgi:hypothetical protein